MPSCPYCGQLFETAAHVQMHSRYCIANNNNNNNNNHTNDLRMPQRSASDTATRKGDGALPPLASRSTPSLPLPSHTPAGALDRDFEYQLLRLQQQQLQQRLQQQQQPLVDDVTAVMPSRQAQLLRSQQDLQQQIAQLKQALLEQQRMEGQEKDMDLLRQEVAAMRRNVELRQQQSQPPPPATPSLFGYPPRIGDGTPPMASLVPPPPPAAGAPGSEMLPYMYYAHPPPINAWPPPQQPQQQQPYPPPPKRKKAKEGSRGGARHARRGSSVEDEREGEGEDRNGRGYDSDSDSSTNSSSSSSGSSGESGSAARDRRGRKYDGGISSSSPTSNHSKRHHKKGRRRQRGSKTYQPDLYPPSQNNNSNNSNPLSKDDELKQMMQRIQYEVELLRGTVIQGVNADGQLDAASNMPFPTSSTLQPGNYTVQFASIEGIDLSVPLADVEMKVKMYALYRDGADYVLDPRGEVTYPRQPPPLYRVSSTLAVFAIPPFELNIQNKKDMFVLVLQLYYRGTLIYWATVYTREVGPWAEGVRGGEGGGAGPNIVRAMQTAEDMLPGAVLRGGLDPDKRDVLEQAEAFLAGAGAAAKVPTTPGVSSFSALAVSSPGTSSSASALRDPPTPLDIVATTSPAGRSDAASSPTAVPGGSAKGGGGGSSTPPPPPEPLPGLPPLGPIPIAGMPPLPGMPGNEGPFLPPTADHLYERFLLSGDPVAAAAAGFATDPKQKAAQRHFFLPPPMGTSTMEWKDRLAKQIEVVKRRLQQRQPGLPQPQPKPQNPPPGAPGRNNATSNNNNNNNNNNSTRPTAPPTDYQNKNNNNTSTGTRNSSSGNDGSLSLTGSYNNSHANNNNNNNNNPPPKRRDGPPTEYSGEDDDSLPPPLNKRLTGVPPPQPAQPPVAPPPPPLGLHERGDGSPSTRIVLDKSASPLSKVPQPGVLKSSPSPAASPAASPPAATPSPSKAPPAAFPLKGIKTAPPGGGRLTAKDVAPPAPAPGPVVVSPGGLPRDPALQERSTLRATTDPNGNLAVPNGYKLTNTTPVLGIERFDQVAKGVNPAVVVGLAEEGETPGGGLVPNDTVKLYLDGVVGVPVDAICTRLVGYIANTLDPKTNILTNRLHHPHFFMRRPDFIFYQDLDSSTIEPEFTAVVPLPITDQTVVVVIVEYLTSRVKVPITLGHCCLPVNKKGFTGSFLTRVKLGDPRRSIARDAESDLTTEDMARQQAQALAQYTQQQLEESVDAQGLHNLMPALPRQRGECVPMGYVLWRFDEPDEDAPYQDYPGQLPLSISEITLFNTRVNLKDGTPAEKGIKTAAEARDAYCCGAVALSDNVSYLTPYQPTVGLFVRVDGIRGMIPAEHSAPALYCVLTDLVAPNPAETSRFKRKCTMLYDWSSDVNAVNFRDPPYVYNNITCDPLKVFIFTLVKLTNIVNDETTPIRAEVVGWTMNKLFLEKNVARQGCFVLPWLEGAAPPAILDALTRERVDRIFLEGLKAHTINFLQPLCTVSISQGIPQLVPQLAEVTPGRPQHRQLLMPGPMKKDFPSYTSEGCLGCTLKMQNERCFNQIDPKLLGRKMMQAMEGLMAAGGGGADGVSADGSIISGSGSGTMGPRKPSAKLSGRRGSTKHSLVNPTARNAKNPPPFGMPQSQQGEPAPNNNNNNLGPKKSSVRRGNSSANMRPKSGGGDGGMSNSGSYREL